MHGGKELDVSLIATIVAVVVAGAILIARFSSSSKDTIKNKYKTRSAAAEDEDTLKPVDDGFDWSTEEPVAHRPFRAGKYHLTMGLKKCSINDWLLIEKTYKWMIETKKINNEKYPTKTIAANDCALAEVRELYSETMGYMTFKYPMIYKIEGDMVHNTVLDTYLPVNYDSETDAHKIMKDLSENIEEDFLILKLGDESKGEDPTRYYLRAVANCVPNGFDPSHKMNMKLSDIHGPVPTYKQTLEMSMDKFFAKLPVNKIVQRVNWTFQTHTDTFSLGNHAGEAEDMKALKLEDVDINNVFQRSERQTLRRLPKTRGLVFTIRTYLYPLVDIAEEERAADLIKAIDGLGAPMDRYKRKLEWGPLVQEYLTKHLEGKGVAVPVS